MRAAVEAPRPCGLNVTVSVGVTAARGADVTFEPLFRAADAALYAAKRAGRNRVVADAPQSSLASPEKLAAGIGLARRRRAA